MVDNTVHGLMVDHAVHELMVNQTVHGLTNDNTVHGLMVLPYREWTHGFTIKCMDSWVTSSAWTHD